ncbi:MAG: serpin family protein [Candidatus Spyradocola sp.]
MFRKLMCIVLCVLLLCATGCVAKVPAEEPTPVPEETPAGEPEETPAPSQDAEPAGDEDPVDMTRVSDMLMQTEGFSVALLKNLKNAYTEQNSLFSPLAFNASIAALYAAADGDTEEELRVMMGYTTEPEDTVDTLSSLIASIDSDRFTLGNSLHLTRRVGFSEEYLNNVASPLRVSTYSQDYADPSTFQAINACAEVFTGGQVSAVLESTAAADTLYLLSAFSVSGAFDQPFDAARTVSGAFESPTGLVSCRMMRGDFTLGYAEDEYMQLVCLPMAGGAMQLRLILPREGGEAAFDEALIQYADAWLSPETETQQSVSLTLPAFTLSSSASYREILSSMGLDNALRAQNVDLTGMLNPDLLLPTPLNDIFSVAALTVSEGGVNLRDGQAAAPVEAEPSEESVELVFDRPFLAAVTDTQTGALLAVGWVNTVAER